MDKREVVSLKKVFVDIHRKTKTKDIPHELYYIVYSSMCGFHAIKITKSDTLELLYDPDKLKCGNQYLDFSKYDIEWMVNYVIGTLENVEKNFLMENYKITQK